MHMHVVVDDVVTIATVSAGNDDDVPRYAICIVAVDV